MQSHNLRYTLYNSPVGELLIARSELGICLLTWPQQELPLELQHWEQKLGGKLRRDTSSFHDVTRQLDQYFSGELTEFNLSLDLQLSTPFRAQAQLAMAGVPYGKTISYSELAELANRPKAIRAAASACATNPIAIVLPCHRILRSDGSLGGFLAGSKVKQFLLDLEQRESK